ncbi:hypothetical protein [Haloplanus aerogenes]|uniref:Uncharacterized protein n=1 Tax=Haloplanus aerogenes TaxID=660522 RepID=A0A3M0D931_9EURY|nr:hypothetical protein [Haloplanus aerogenes]AZH26291.1 hypothetical protein DU502_13370 [Haloplanus aerogenes]RMB18251.1 hypothetical protein ATH50_1701 [Haloplanus aerogenes]
MSEAVRGRYRDTLLIERIAELAGFDHLATWLFGSAAYGSYLFVAVGLLIEYGLFDVYNYLVTGKSSFITSPNALAIPAMTVLGLVGLRYIHDEYARAVVSLGIEDEHVGLDRDVRRNFEGLVSFRVRLGAYALALVCYYAFVTLVLGIPELVEISGIGLVLYAQLVTFPLIIVPVLTELAVSYVAVHVLVPRRLKNADLGLFFYDPRNLGGFEPIGELLKRSYYIYTAILLLWFLQTHAPVLLASVVDSPYPAPGPIFQVVLSGIWFVGVVTIGYSMFRIHRLMKSKKEARLRTLEAEIKDALADPYDATPTNIDDRAKYDNAQESLEQVKRTKTYPTTFTMWSQIFLSVLLPQALNMVVKLPQ